MKNLKIFCIVLVAVYFLVAAYGYHHKKSELNQLQIESTKLSIEILKHKIKKLKGEL